MRTWFALAITSLLIAQSALAQSQPRPHRPPLVIELDPDVIEGERKEPGGEIVVPQATRTFRTVIQLRTEFRREILSSVSLL